MQLCPHPSLSQEHLNSKSWCSSTDFSPYNMIIHIYPKPSSYEYCPTFVFVSYLPFPLLCSSCVIPIDHIRPSGCVGTMGMLWLHSSSSPYPPFSCCRFSGSPSPSSCSPPWHCWLLLCVSLLTLFWMHVSAHILIHPTLSSRILWLLLVLAWVVSGAQSSFVLDIPASRLSS